MNAILDMIFTDAVVILIAAGKIAIIGVIAVCFCSAVYFLAAVCARLLAGVAHCCVDLYGYVERQYFCRFNKHDLLSYVEHERWHDFRYNETRSRQIQMERCARAGCTFKRRIK